MGEVDEVNLTSDEKRRSLGRRALGLSIGGYLVVGAVVAALSFNMVRVDGFLVGFVGFFLMQIIALIMGIQSLRNGWQGKVATVLAALGTAAWIWIVVEFFRTPIRLF